MKPKKLGQLGDLKHSLHPDYKKWGCKGETNVKSIKITNELLAPILKPLETCQLSLMDFHLQYANQISYYQGEQLTEATALLLRFESSNNQNNNLGGEHITIIYDCNQHRLLGFTDMHLESQHKNPVTHQQALTVALDFLKKAAPDLLPEKVVTPELITLSASARMDFEPEIPFGKLLLHWIANHDETITVNGKEQIIHGMKVKFEIPSQNLWAWVIVTPDAHIQTFERNVSWNMKSMQRNTQMWLHDQWLMAQKITLSAITN